MICFYKRFICAKKKTAINSGSLFHFKVYILINYNKTVQDFLQKEYQSIF